MFRNGEATSFVVGFESLIVKHSLCSKISANNAEAKNVWCTLFLTWYPLCKARISGIVTYINCSTNLDYFMRDSAEMQLSIR